LIHEGIFPITGLFFSSNFLSAQAEMKRVETKPIKVNRNES